MTEILYASVTYENSLTVSTGLDRDQTFWLRTGRLGSVVGHRQQLLAPIQSLDPKKGAMGLLLATTCASMRWLRRAMFGVKQSLHPRLRRDAPSRRVLSALRGATRDHRRDLA